MADRIAITGTGVLSAAGPGVNALYETMLAEQTVFTTTSRDCPFPWAISQFNLDCASWPSGSPWDSVEKYANKTARIAVAVTGQTLEHSGMPCAEDPFRGASVVAVNSSGGEELNEVIPSLAVAARRDSRALPKFLYDEVPDYSYIRGIPSQMGQFVSMANGFRGSNVAIYGETGVKGLGALGVAYRLIDSGEADAAMVVGISAKPSVSSLVSLDREEPLAKKASPGCGPFDAGRQGILVGQGAASVLIERESMARARGAQVLAYLDACQVVSARHRRAALEFAVDAVLGEGSEDLVLWVANASGSPDGDLEEFEVVHVRAAVPVTSARGTIGTAFETAALIDVALAVESLRRKAAPPIGLVSAPDPALDGLDPIIGTARELSAGAVLITGWNHGKSSGTAGAALITSGDST